MVEVSSILQQIESGDPVAADKLLPLVYDELRRLAEAKLAHEKPGQTLQATALVHEAYLKLVNGNAVTTFANRHHFFAAAAEAMRRILVDQARRKLAVRRGGERNRVADFDERLIAESDSQQTLILDDMLDHLGDTNPRQCEVAKMRLFLGLTFAEIAEVAGISPDTAETDWAFARAWLKREWARSR